MLLASFPCLFVTLNTSDELEAILPVPFESLFFLAPFSGKHPSFKCYSFVMLFSLFCAVKQSAGTWFTALGSRTQSIMGRTAQLGSPELTTLSGVCHQIISVNLEILKAKRFSRLAVG